jgi:hypothetical protein
VADEDTRHQASIARSDGYTFSRSGGPAINENDPETGFEQEPGMDAFIAGFRDASGNQVLAGVSRLPNGNLISTFPRCAVRIE